LKKWSLSILESLKRRRKIKKDKLLTPFFYLKKMEEKDVASVLAIEKVSFTNPWQEATFLGEISNRSISFPYVIVHKDLDKVIGYIIYWKIKGEVQISNIAVHPDFRQRGIAEAVLRQVMNELKREGAEFITLEVRPSNTAALHLYRKLGFEILGIRKNYYTHPQEHALVMGKYLS